jgi:pimeloyl-ACP methyl ester carboxylesterase
MEAHGPALPDYRSCDDALSRVGTERPGTSQPVNLGQSKLHLVGAFIPGIGYDCVEDWLNSAGTVAAHLRTLGYDFMPIKVDAMSSSAHNAQQIRDALMATPSEGGTPRIVLFGYSKGAPDMLEALVNYPEIRTRVAGAVSLAGAIGGSPLANKATQSQANMMRYFPGAKCGLGDQGGVESLRTDTRRTWLANNALPSDVRYYSVVAFPKPDRISSIMRNSYDQLARIDGRNDGQMIFYDEVIPRGVLVGYINADHWAIALPIARSHPTLGRTFVNQNGYPREALAEALLRFVEEDILATAPESRALQ